MALNVGTLFVWERGYSHQTYTQIKMFISRYGKDELRSRCDSKYLYFIDFEPVFYVYSRFYSLLKKIIKEKNVKRKLVD